jgi:APA family basic amino acid/polyamine antiporter
MLTMSKKYGHLLRVLGIAFGWAVTVGNTIGAGILRAPGEVAQKVPVIGAFYAVWAAGGLFVLLGALSLAELGAMIPESGGQVVFVRRAFGPVPGFAVAWSDWLSTCASAAAITIVLVDAVVALLPHLYASHLFISVALVLAFAWIQWSGIKSGSNVQLITSALKAVAFIALILACFIAPHAERAVATTSITVAPLAFAGLVVAMQLMIYTYDGWAGVLYFSGEIENPGRDIPRSMISGVLSVTVIYLLVNAAFLHVLPLHKMAGDVNVADTAAQLVFGRTGITLVRVLIAVSLLSAINSCILMGSRIAYAMGAKAVNVGGTPTLGLGITTVVTIGFLLSGTFNTVIAMAAFFFVANYAMSFASVFRLRAKEPATPRPYRAWGYPYTTAFMLLASVAFLVSVVIADPRHTLFGILLIAVSYPVYRILQLTSPDPGMELT